MFIITLFQPNADANSITGGIIKARQKRRPMASSSPSSEAFPLFDLFVHRDLPSLLSIVEIDTLEHCMFNNKYLEFVKKFDDFPQAINRLFTLSVNADYHNGSGCNFDPTKDNNNLMNARITFANTPLLKGRNLILIAPLDQEQQQISTLKASAQSSIIFTGDQIKRSGYKSALEALVNSQGPQTLIISGHGDFQTTAISPRETISFDSLTPTIDPRNSTWGIQVEDLVEALKRRASKFPNENPGSVLIFIHSCESGSFVYRLATKLKEENILPPIIISSNEGDRKSLGVPGNLTQPFSYETLNGLYRDGHFDRDHNYSIWVPFQQNGNKNSVIKID